MVKFVYSIIDNTNTYDELETFDNAEEAIYRAIIKKERVAVLDALSLAYYGEI